MGFIKAFFTHWKRWMGGGRVRTPTILQMEAVECGAAALGVLLEYHGQIVPLVALRRECGVSRDGSKASNLLKVARHYGFIAKAFTLESEAFWSLPTPNIVYWNFNHFVVVEGRRRGRVYLNDPATGPRTISLEEFDQAFTGVVLVLRPGPDFTPGGRKPSLTHALYTRLRHSGTAVVCCLIAGFFLALLGLALPVFTQLVVDQILIRGILDWGRPLVFGMLVTAVCRGFLMLVQLQTLRQLKLKLATVMSCRFVWHLLHLPISYYTHRYAGEISSRTHLNDKVAEVLSGRLATTVIDATMMVVYAGVMLLYDAVLTLVGLSCAAVNLLALQWLSRRRVEANMRLLQDRGKASGIAIAGLQTMEMMKASAAESAFFARWVGHYSKAVNAQQDLEVANQLLSILSMFLTALTSMLTLVVGGFRIIEGHLTLGMLVAFQSLMHSFLLPITRLVDLGGTLQELRGDLHRLDDVLHHPAIPTSRADVQPVTRHTFQLQGAVDVRNVTFGHSRVSTPVLDHVSFALDPGKRVAVVGASGSGKSTLAKLVCGLYEPWTGDILFDGTPRSQIAPQALSHALALVDQDIVFFSGTIRENLTLWDTTITDAQLRRACQDAAIYDLIVALPGGYESELLEGGANLSGGQRQRLEIARALVHDPTILVMDEATSALDAETEQQIVRQLRHRACTCLMIAHRLSTIRDCDEIIVLDQGKVVQRGTHEALLREGGIYARLLDSETDTFAASEDSRTEAA